MNLKKPAQDSVLQIIMRMRCLELSDMQNPYIMIKNVHGIKWQKEL